MESGLRRPGRLSLSEADAAIALGRRFSVAVVLHTATSDWSKQQLAGIVTTLGQYSAAVVEVVDCGFDSANQIAALERLSGEGLDAIISIPIGNTTVADAHRGVSRAGTKLVLMDNAPSGLIPGKEYVSVVSADNFGLGQIGAQLLSSHVPKVQRLASSPTASTSSLPKSARSRSENGWGASDLTSL